MRGPACASMFADDCLFLRPPSQVSRAMTKRYFGDLDNYAESDVVIIGAGE